MSYLSPAQLADGQGALDELAQLFELPSTLLRATLDGSGRGEWTPEEVAAADAAVASVEAVIERAVGEVHSRLARRGYALPLDAQQFPVLTTWTRAIARYHLQIQRDRTNETTGRIERDYRDALRALDAVAAGKLGLGVGDPLVQPTAGIGMPAAVAGRREFGDAELRGY